LDVISPIARRAGSSGGVFRRFLAQTVAAELEAMGIVNDAVAAAALGPSLAAACFLQRRVNANLIADDC